MSASANRIVLLGKTGYGKSSLGNTIFGEKVFMVDHTSKSGTSKCKAETRCVHGRSITLIDTPGFFDTDMSEEDLKAEIVKCIVECAPGPHAFLILLKVERFSEHEKAVIEKPEEYFSDEVCKYAALVFTHGDQLQEGQKIEDFLSEDQSLMEKFAGGCHVIDNKYWNQENPEDEYRSNKFQVEQLLKSVDETIKINQGGYYTNEMLQKVSEKIQEEKEKIRSSSKNMSEDEVEERANQNVFMKLLILFAGTSTGALLGALLGVKIMVEVAVKLLTKFNVLVSLVALGGRSALLGEGGAVVGAAAAAKAAAKTAFGAVAGAGVVGGVAGGFVGYFAAVDAETPLEAMKKAAEAVNEGADSLLNQMEKLLKD